MRIATESFWLTPLSNSPIAGWNPGYLGDDSVTGVGDTGWAGYKGGVSFTATEVGYAYSISSRIGVFTSSATTRAAIYDDDAGAPGSLLASSSDQVVGTGSDQSVTWTLNNVIKLEVDQTYWLIIGFSTAGTVEFSDNHVGIGSHVYQNNPLLTDPFGAASTAGSYPSIWASYYRLAYPQSISASRDIRITGFSNYSYARQWQRADDSGFTTNVTDISGATGLIYTLQSADQGKYIRMSVVATNTDTGGVSSPAYSNVLGPVAAAGPPPQHLHPASDITIGSWQPTPSSPTTLYDKISETVYDDGNYIYSSTSPVSADIAEVKLDPGGDPASSTGHYVRYRYEKNATGGDRIDLTVRLMQGATEIASWTHTDIDVGVTHTIQTLTGTQADSITDYSNLRLRFEAVAVFS